MRIALFSDTHGNLPATEAALAAIARARPDQVICLGDVAMFGPQPRETLAAIAALGCPVVMGNTDAWALDPQPFTIRKPSDELKYDVELWGARQLTPDDQAFIRTFQPTITLDLGHGRSLLCCHGSPRHFSDVIRATTPDAELAEKLAGRRAAVIAGGHTHTPLLRRFENSLVINPGSVGLPIFWRNGQIQNPVWAEYALLRAENGRLDVSFRRVPYSLAGLETAVRASAMPHQEAFLQDWLAADAQ